MEVFHRELVGNRVLFVFGFVFFKKMEEPSGREVKRRKQKQKLEDEERDAQSYKIQGFQTISPKTHFLFRLSLFSL